MARKGENLTPGMPNPSRRKATGKAPPFFAVMSEALESVPPKVMPIRHRALLLVMAGFCNPDGTECFPTTARLAKRCGTSRRRIAYMLAELEAARWIERRPRFLPGSGGQTSTYYTLHLHAGPVAQLPRARPGRATSFIRPVSKAERDAAGVLDLGAVRAAKKAATDK